MSLIISTFLHIFFKKQWVDVLEKWYVFNFGVITHAATCDQVARQMFGASTFNTERVETSLFQFYDPSFM